eukprot:15443409-Alexandrium_andersonii.AAC.1
MLLGVGVTTGLSQCACASPAAVGCLPFVGCHHGNSVESCPCPPRDVRAVLVSPDVVRRPPRCAPGFVIHSQVSPSGRARSLTVPVRAR